MSEIRISNAKETITIMGVDDAIAQLHRSLGCATRMMYQEKIRYI